MPFEGYPWQIHVRYRTLFCNDQKGHPALPAPVPGGFVLAQRIEVGEILSAFHFMQFNEEAEVAEYSGVRKNVLLKNILDNIRSGCIWCNHLTINSISQHYSPHGFDPGRGAEKSAPAYFMQPARTYVYIDGFNLYYRAVKGTPYRWLDLKAMVCHLLGPQNDVKSIISLPLSAAAWTRISRYGKRLTSGR